MKRDSHTCTFVSGGSVLIVVLWACLGLVSITLLFGHSMLMSYRGSDNDLSGRQADQAVEGAAQYARTLLLNAQTPGEFPDKTSYQREAVEVGDATFWLIGRSLDDATGRTREFGLVDEAAKINLNLDSTATPAQYQAFSTMLQSLPLAGMTPEFADAICDWQDADDDVFGSGAESETYLRKTPAYKAKNARFESIEELALVNGATAEVLYGEDANLNGVLDPNEDDGDKTLPSDNSDGKLDLGLLEYVTVFSREPEKDVSGNALLVLLNPPPPPPLAPAALAQLQTDLNNVSVDAQTIMTNLGNSYPTSMLDLLIRGSVTADDEEKIVAAFMGRSVSGLINVNTASEAVLGCVPGLQQDAAALVAARLTLSSPGASMLWLKDVQLAQNVIDEAGPYLTGRSFQVTADVAAVGRHGRGYRRMKMVIDANPDSLANVSTTGTGIVPNSIHRRNLAPLGWALGSEIRQSLELKKEVR